MDNYCSKKYIVRYTKTEIGGGVTTCFDYEDDDMQKCIDYIDRKNQYKRSDEYYELIENTPLIY